MRISLSLPSLFAVLLMNCAQEHQSADPWFMKLPVYHDPRPQYVLFSWAAPDGEFRFELVHDPEMGSRRNDFLDRFGNRRTRPPGLDLIALERAVSGLPKTSVIEWWIDRGRDLRLPPAEVVQRIWRILARRHFELHFTDADKGMA